MLDICKLVLIFALNVLSARCYIPAVPSNDTEKAITAGLNVTDISKLNLHWFSKGSYSENVSFQLAGNGSTGMSRGALVHFSEETVNNSTAPTLTPWIALVSCDKNATNMSLAEDIFTMARDKGAVAAVLYSLTSAACIINQEYTDPSTFDQVFDIFSTQSLTSAKLIEYQFGQIATQNDSIYSYDSKRLNDSQTVIEQSIKTGDAASAGYLFAVLKAYNATGNLQDALGNSTSPNTGTPPSTSSSNSNALAMIVLYAITGCVSGLFIIVIVSGAIRALQHPERYGPRAHRGDNGAPPQSRARGLTRAILDTFPLVKFGTPASAPSEMQDHQKKDDVENTAAESFVHLEHDGRPRDASTSSDEFPTVSGSSAAASDPTERTPGYLVASLAAAQEITPGNSILRSRGQGERLPMNVSTTSLNNNDDVVLAQIGRETCPICIVDFEEGDDIRVLPCDGKHCFHQYCVDPWLLKLSSSCPICRHDFLALENLIAGNLDVEDQDLDQEQEEQQGQQAFQTPRQQNGRFSRYLRFARLHQHERRRGGMLRDSLLSLRTRRESIVPARSTRNSVMHPMPGPSTS